MQVTVVAPVNQPRQGYVVYDDTRRAAARRRLDKTLDLLRGAGIPATGFVVEADPVAALRDAIDAARAADEIDRLDAPGAEVRLAAPERRRPDAARRRAAAGRARRRRSHARVGRGERARRRERDGPRRDAARADPRARGREPRRASSSSRRRATGGGAYEAAERRLRRALSAPPRGGARRARPDRAPRSVHRRHARRRGRARRRDHRLDVPERALRLAAPGPRSTRLRNDTELPVEHVEVDVPSEVLA